MAARAVAAPRAHEQMALLVLLARDADGEIATAAQTTLDRVPAAVLRGYLGLGDVPPEVRSFFATRPLVAMEPGVEPVSVVVDLPLVQEGLDSETVEGGEDSSAQSASERQETLLQKLQKMTFTERVKAAMRGTREMRAILIRDPNKVVSTAVLSSPKVSEAEVESFAKMATVSEDVLRTVAMNRAWLKNYSVVLALTKNSKTPLAISLNLLNRLTERDMTGISTDRNVPDPLRIAARRRLAMSANR